MAVPSERPALRILTPWPPLHFVERGNEEETILPSLAPMLIAGAPLSTKWRGAGGEALKGRTRAGLSLFIPIRSAIPPPSPAPATPPRPAAPASRGRRRGPAPAIPSLLAGERLGATAIRPGGSPAGLPGRGRP